MMKVEPRNPIHKDKSYELCLPDQIRRIVVQDLLDEEGERIDQIHGGLHFCWISSETDPGPFALLREQIDDEVGAPG